MNKSDYFSDDLLGTPQPAQSTLIANGGKPVSRVTQFSLRQSLIPFSPIPPEHAKHTEQSSKRKSNIDVIKEIVARNYSNAEVENENDIEDNDHPLISEQPEGVNQVNSFQEDEGPPRAEPFSTSKK